MEDNTLPTVLLDGLPYYFDERLMQLRNKYNPKDCIDIDEIELYLILETIREGGTNVFTEDI